MLHALQDTSISEVLPGWALVQLDLCGPGQEVILLN